MNDETVKLRQEQEKMKQLIESEAWRHAHKKLIRKCGDAMDVTTIKHGSVEDIAAQVVGRRLAVEIVVSWLQDVIGDATMYSDNAIYDESREEIISRFDFPEASTG